MRAAIMQPYFFPYVGYFQLIQSVDRFILYDNIKYTKKGWITRNRLLRDGKDWVFSIPLKNASDFLDVRDRVIAADFRRDKLLNQINEAYRRSPYFEQAFPLVKSIVLEEETNLFDFLHNSIKQICNYLDIRTEIVVSSHLQIDHSLQSKDKVLALCRHVGADVYINAIGGQELYSKEDFSKSGIQLRFIKSRPFQYKQFGHAFVPWLSIVDVLMFNSKEVALDYVTNEYDLI
jgi:hypothetical protein